MCPTLPAGYGVGSRKVAHRIERCVVLRTECLAEERQGLFAQLERLVPAVCGEAGHRQGFRRFQGVFMLRAIGDTHVIPGLLQQQDGLGVETESMISPTEDEL